MKSKAILIGIDLAPGKTTFASTRVDAERWGAQMLDGLTPEERKTASVRIIEIREVVVGELR